MAAGVTSRFPQDYGLVMLEPAPVREPPTEANGTHLTQMRALVVEDDRDVAAYLVKGLKEHGYTVDHAEDGKNGFASDDPAELADRLGFLSENRDACRALGQAARETAIDVFHIDRFLSDWNRIIDETLGHPR